jgi:hypothetical protein
MASDLSAGVMASRVRVFSRVTGTNGAVWSDC